MQIAQRPSIYVLDTPGVLVPTISDIETGLKLALAGLKLLYIFYVVLLKKIPCMKFPSSKFQ